MVRERASPGKDRPGTPGTTCGCPGSFAWSIARVAEVQDNVSCRGERALLMALSMDLPRLWHTTYDVEGEQGSGSV